MTTLILQLSPITLKKDETDWINDEVRFTVLVTGPNMGQAQTEKFQVFRYENEGYEKICFGSEIWYPSSKKQLSVRTPIKNSSM